MRIISYNVNGIRAAIKRGFIEWLKTNSPHIVCIQEVKAHEADIDRTALRRFDKKVDDYSKIMLQALAEPFAELLHERTRKEF